MKFIVLFLISTIAGFAVFGAFGMVYGMEFGHGFCFAVSAGPLCPEVISAFFSHLNIFQTMFVSVLREIFVLTFFALWCIALCLLPRRNYLHFAFRTRMWQDFLPQFAVAKQEFLSWLAFHDQSPTFIFGA